VIRQITQTVIALFIFAAAFYVAAVAAHGNVTMEEDSCMRNIGESLIHLSAYQPRVDVKAHYCTEIPQTGETIIVVDLVDPALRNMPISMKIYQGSGKDIEPIVNMAADFYKDGIISTSAELMKAGQYVVAITAEGIPPLKYQYLLRVGMINYANVFRIAIGPLVGLIIILFILYKFFTSERYRQWRAARRKLDD